MNLRGRVVGDSLTARLQVRTPQKMGAGKRADCGRGSMLGSRPRSPDGRSPPAWRRGSQSSDFFRGDYSAEMVCCIERHNVIPVWSKNSSTNEFNQLPRLK